MKPRYQRGLPPRALLVTAMFYSSMASHAQPLSKNAAPFEKVELNGGGVGVMVQLEKRRILLSGLDFKNCMEIVDTRAPGLPWYSPAAWRPDMSVDWSGGCVDGFRSGAGTLTYVDYSRRTVHTMAGSYEDGQRIGDWSSSSMGNLKFAPSQAIPPDILAAATNLSKTLRLPGNLASRLSEHLTFVRSRQPGSTLAAAGQTPTAEQLATQTTTPTPQSPLPNPSTPTTQNHTAPISPTQLDCRSTLNFLSQRLPSFTLSELNTMRSAILAQDVTQAIAGAKSQGYTSDNAIKAAMAQAREFDRVSREAAQCTTDVDALGASDEDFLAAMRQGKAPANCNGIRNACLCAGIVNRLSAVGTRALAAEMQCFARSGRW